jgi:amino acid transporter
VIVLYSLIIDLGGVPGQERIGFRYWKNGKAFLPYKTTGDLGKFLGFVNGKSMNSLGDTIQSHDRD